MSGGDVPVDGAPRQRSKDRAVSAGAAILATGALACGVCCVLPFALPAAALAVSGGVIAWFAGAHGWLTATALVAVMGAWAWVLLQSLRSRRRPAPATLSVLAIATAFMAIALLWPRLEPYVLAALRR